ncbi:MAG: hypothetical protein R3E08_04260 [Thiotrichaceae bacterium]
MKAESIIQDDVWKLRQRGVHCFLIDEAFMMAPDPGQALLELVY